MKRIHIVLPNLGGGGAERVSIDLAREFAKKYDVEIVLCNATGELLDEAKDEFKIVALQASNKLEIIRSLTKHVNKEKPDYLIASMWGLTVFATLAKLLAKHKPQLLLVEHSSLINQFNNSGFKVRLWLKVSTFFAYRVANAVAGVSIGVAKDMAQVARLRKCPQVLYNPIPVFSETSETTKNRAKVIITAGRLIEAKSYDVLIHAFSLLPDKTVKLVVLGEGELLEKLQSLARSLGVDSRITFLGFVDNPRANFQSADLFVLSSVREGLPTVLIEALGCGTPVVSTDCKHGPREILNDGEYGSLVPVGDAEALSAAIEESLSKTHDKQKLINRARDFAPEVSAKRYLEVLGIEK
ncbi:glycosyltransferase [Vibrio cyclitrophicus]